VRDYSIRADNVVRYVGVYSPVVVYPFGRMLDSELFSHVFQSTNQPHLTTFYELANSINCPHSNNCLLEFICQDFKSPKLIQFRTPPQNAPNLPLLCVKFARFQKPWFIISFVTKTQHTVSNSHVHPLQHVLPAVTGPNTLGVVSTHSGYTSETSNKRGFLFVHLV
jgi:hypothetical protein